MKAVVWMSVPREGEWVLLECRECSDGSILARREDGAVESLTDVERKSAGLLLCQARVERVMETLPPLRAPERQAAYRRVVEALEARDEAAEALEKLQQDDLPF